MIQDLTFVVIGKNEASNLPRCFSSIKKISQNIVYVDSDSSDNSIEIAKKFDIKIILKVKSSYGTPALSRSVGAKKVNTKYIQFVDGDMELDTNWPTKAIKRLESNSNIVAVHGYKKVFTHNTDDFFILSDKNDWEADYLQGAFLINKDSYIKAGGLDGRFYGEEERDLYIRIKSIGYEVWYIHQLMGSHYDLKKKSITRIFFSDSCASIWIPLIKAIKAKNVRSYVFVYRALLLPFLLDIISIFSIFFGFKKFIIIGIILQCIELVYCLSINRKGYFIIWKVAFINLFKAIKIYRRDISYNVETF
tara:strand:- start:254 stop:1171 length:918 start_codon:yes stop_codon:yes gene_type:complete